MLVSPANLYNSMKSNHSLGGGKGVETTKLTASQLPPNRPAPLAPPAEANKAKAVPRPPSQQNVGIRTKADSVRRSHLAKADPPPYTQPHKSKTPIWRRQGVEFYPQTTNAWTNNPTFIFGAPYLLRILPPKN